MTKMTRNELLEALAEYGYELNRPMHHYKPMEVLLNLVKENDPRLLEGFPVAYDNMLNQKPPLNWKSYNDYLNKELSEDDRNKLFYLLLLSYLLFRLYGEDKLKLQETEYALSNLSSKWKDDLKDVENKFNYSDSVKINDRVDLSTERLKNQFRNYVVHFGSKSETEPKMNMELEVLLSQFFAPKQKEVLKKRLRGEELSKTEREYFYRVVSKRLRALGNENLHQFAKSVVV